RNIHIFSSDRGALQAICQPRDQSGQETIRQIYQGIRMLQVHNHVQLAWSPVLGFDLGQKAKQAAKIATEPNRTPQRRTPAALSTVINQQRTRQGAIDRQIEGVGQHLRQLDIAIPGPHTRKIYDSLNWKQASVLAQLRTGIARLNSYLYRIGA
ncbi:hypothetical protein M433DRAFT_35427, partial [Acidomyces richmondensis BFW]